MTISQAKNDSSICTVGWTRFNSGSEKKDLDNKNIGGATSNVNVPRS